MQTFIFLFYKQHGREKIKEKNNSNHSNKSRPKTKINTIIFCSLENLRHLLSHSSYSVLLCVCLRSKPNPCVCSQVFRCLPSSLVRNMSELEQYQSKPGLAQTDQVRAQEELRKIRGFLVQFPLDFLSEQNLMPSVGTKEAMVPTEIWT